MSKKPTQFTDEEKAAIALKALSGGDESVKQLADEYNLPENEIKKWMQHYKKDVNDKDPDEVSLDASEDFTRSVEYGASFDNLNYKRLTFWSVFGVAAVLLFIVAIIYVHDYTTDGFGQDRAADSQFYEIQEIQQRDQATLGSFGVVDPDEGIYRIPIDSAITIIAED